MPTFPTFPAADPANPYATLVGFASVPVQNTPRVHAFASYAYSVENNGPYMETLCAAYWHFHDEAHVAMLSTDEAGFLSLLNAQTCADCKTQYQRLKQSGLAAPLAITVQVAALGAAGA